MLAKVIAHAPTRAEAVRVLAHALAGARVHGLTTNRDLLVRSLRHPEFTAGRLDTGFYGRHLDALTAETPDDAAPALAALAAALADAAPAPGAPLAARVGAWRNVVSQPQTRRYEIAGAPYEVGYHPARSGPRSPWTTPASASWPPRPSWSPSKSTGSDGCST